jgi:hypothetical protein
VHFNAQTFQPSLTQDECQAEVVQELASIISTSLADENSALEKPQLALASSAEIQVMSPKQNNTRNSNKKYYLQ